MEDSKKGVQDLEEFYGKLSPGMEVHGDDQDPLENSFLMNETEVKCKDFDDILTIIGSQGKFQKILLYGVVCPFVTISPFLVLNYIFLLDIPDHWCHVPGMQNNQSIQEWKNWTLPTEIGPDGRERLSQCLMYDPTDPQRNSTIKCLHGWEYDKTDYESTIPSAFNWVCDKVHYSTDVFTWSTMGSVVGTVLFGILADKVGRKPVYFMTCTVNIVFRIAALFVPQHVTLFLGLQFLAGAAFPCIFSMPALIVAEICGAEYRSWTYAVTWMIWVVGNSLLPLVAWVCRTWLLFGLVSSLPGILIFFCYPILCESPRWLISVGKGKEALEIIKKMASTNGVIINDKEMQQMVQYLVQKQKEEQSKTSIGVWTLFQKFRLARNTIMLTMAWSMNSLLYYGITLNTTSMAGNKFLNYFLLSLIELPSGYLAGILVEKTGRRWTQAAFFLLCVISCFICALAVLHTQLDTLVIVGALGIKFGVTITSMVVYLQGAEIFPTQLRSTGNGVASTISSLMGVAGPYIVFTGKFDASLPYFILALLSAIGLFSSATLPETFKQHLPETVEDANNFGKGVKFWSYLPKTQKEEMRGRSSSINNNSQKL